MTNANEDETVKLWQSNSHQCNQEKKRDEWQRTLSQYCCCLSTSNMQITFAWAEGYDADSRLGLEYACSTRGEHPGCGCVSHRWTAPLWPGTHIESYNKAYVNTQNRTIFLLLYYSAPHRTHISHLPSSSRTASVASRGSSNSTKAKPGGFLATQTLRRGP